MLWKTIPDKWDALWTYSFPMYSTRRNFLRVFGWHLKTHEMMGDTTPSQEWEGPHGYINNSPIFPQQKNPRALCQGSSPNFKCSHISMEIFLFYEIGKKRGNKKRVVSARGGSRTYAFSQGLGTLSGSHPWVPLPQENTLEREPPLQLKSTRISTHT